MALDLFAGGAILEPVGMGNSGPSRLAVPQLEIVMAEGGVYNPSAVIPGLEFLVSRARLGALNVHKHARREDPRLAGFVEGPLLGSEGSVLAGTDCVLNLMVPLDHLLEGDLGVVEAGIWEVRWQRRSARIDNLVG